LSRIGRDDTSMEMFCQSEAELCFAYSGGTDKYD
jgi:hypothetical protein